MKIIDLKQGSQEWLLWRKSLLTATDAPALLGVSPYTTAFKAWQRKLGLIDEQKSTVAMQRGNDDEPIARAMFVEEYGIPMTPYCVESSEYNYLGASLDGLSECKKYILEIKSNGDKYHNALLTDGIPVFHLAQMYHQLLVTGAEKCFYFSYNKGNRVCIEVVLDPKWVLDYMPKAADFWKKIVFKEQPSLSKKDYVDMESNASWAPFAQQYRDVCKQISALEEIKDSLRKEIINLCGDDNCTGAGIKVLKKIAKGRVDYNAIPALKGLNLDEYRKPQTAIWTILLD